MALLLRAENLRVLFGIRTIFDIETIEIFDGDRIGLVGDNGAGKSTLLSVLHGDRAPDEGTVRRYADSAIVRQFGEAEDAPADSAFAARLRAKDDVHEGISGGELERLRIARALSIRAPLLLADEPTTNLDFDGVAQVRKALSAHRGALLLISHDRALLDDLCTVIWELEDGKLHIYPGNYTDYREQKERTRDFQRFEYQQYRQEQARLRAAMAETKESARQIKKTPKRMGNSEARLHKRGVEGVREKVEKSAKAMQSRIDNMEAKERPREDGQIRMALSGRQGITSQAAVRVDNLALRAGGQTLLQKASFTLATGARTVLVGPNGCGKTTLLRAIRDELPGVRISPGVTIGWFGQETLDTLDLSLTLLENVMRDSLLPVHQARTLMARMGLTAADMEKPASVLSGGERAKAALARLMACGATLLLLDEPGNHLDLRALEALEEMLSAYEGTMLLVSHDRRMIDRVAQRLLLFENGELSSFDGNLEDLERARAPKPASAMDEDILRMRMTALLARMSAPKKGDKPDALTAEYDALAEQLRQMRR